MDIDKLVKICKKYDYGYRIMGKKPRVVLVGEMHENDLCLDAQEEIIETVSPSTILHEAAYPELNYREAIKRILEWKAKYGVPVGLCDIPYKNQLKPMASRIKLEEILSHILNDFGFSGDYETNLAMTTPLREKYMARIIMSHFDRGNIPLVAVVGAKHVMPDSKIYENWEVEGKNIDYMAIVQNPAVLRVLRENANFFMVYKV